MGFEPSRSSQTFHRFPILKIDIFWFVCYFKINSLTLHKKDIDKVWFIPF
jgi:hypothetical protein